MIKAHAEAGIPLAKGDKILLLVPFLILVWPYEPIKNFKLQAIICTPLQVNTKRISEEILVKCSVFWALDCNPDTLLSIRPFTCDGTDVIGREGKKLGRRCTAYLGYLGVGLSGVTFEKVME